MAVSGLILFTDLDRTLLPNGNQVESPQARTYFRRLAEHDLVTLVYVTGRHQDLVQQAVSDFNIPEPDFVITDVGTQIWDLREGTWQVWKVWEQQFADDWAGKRREELAELLLGVDKLQLQEQAKQNTYKLSYYVPQNADRQKLGATIKQRLSTVKIDARIVWSIDETANTGLLDILPLHAGKLEAIEFLSKQLGYSRHETVFAGDSGNDLSVLASRVPAILVANAIDAVRIEALAEAVEAGTVEHLYLAQGNFMGMNGNYSAGIVEGVIHFRPELRSWLVNNA